MAVTDRIVQVAAGSVLLRDRIVQVVVSNPAVTGPRDRIVQVEAGNIADDVPAPFTIDAGPNQRVEPGVTVTLAGTPAGGTPDSYLWLQDDSVYGVQITSPNSQNPTFTAPFLKVTGVLVFRLYGQKDGYIPATDTVSITVNAHTRWQGDNPRILHI